MKIMFDLNIFLDVFQERIPHHKDSSIALSKVLNKEVTGFIAGHSLTTIFYLLKKYSGYDRTMEVIDLILNYFEVKSANKKMFRHSRQMNIRDFEDAVVASCAEFAKCDYIVTRNEPDFDNSKVLAINPREFLKKFESHEIEDI